MKVSEMIYQARVKKRLSQQKTGNTVGCSKNYISSLELGTKYLGSLEMIQKLSKCLKIPLKELKEAVLNESLERYKKRLKNKWGL